MNSSYIKALFCVFAFVTVACEQVNFAPSIGRVEGVITDNTGDFVEGAEVSASFIKPSDNGEGTPRTINTITDSDGYYFFDEVFDEVVLTVRTPQNSLRSKSRTIAVGSDDFEETQDFVLEGVPMIQIATLDSTSISLSLFDQTRLEISLEDTYNSLPGSNYMVDLIMVDSSGTAARSFGGFNVVVQAAEVLVLDRILMSQELQGLRLGSYSLIIELADVDGNQAPNSSGSQLLLVE